MQIGRGVAIAFALLLLSGGARATEPSPEAKVRCRSAYERGQQLKLEGQASQARVALRVCSETCPPPFATDCERWTTEVEALLPTVSLRAQGGAGERLTGVRVLVDGQLLADPIPEGPIAVDPGARVLRFERAGFAPVDVNVRLEPGERNHEVAVTLREAIPPASAEPKASWAGSSRLPSYVLGGVGATALLVGGGIAVMGHIERSRLVDTCSPACDPALVDPIRGLWLASGIVAGAGIASLALSILLLPRAASARTTASFVPVAGGGLVSAAIPLR